MSLSNELSRRIGQFPGVEIRIRSVQTVGVGAALSIREFLSYSFKSSMLVPADAFNFTFAAPADPRPFKSYFSEGDIVELYCNERLLATGIIEMIRISVDAFGGEQVSVSGRDFMGQLEDQDAVNLDSSMVYLQNASAQQVFSYLAKNTRFQRFRLQDFPATAKPLFSTQAGESKLATLMRYMEPLNILAWCDPDGTLVLGKPNMGSEVNNRFVFIDKGRRTSNCLSMEVTYAAATVPNAYIPVWVEQIEVQSRVAPAQVLLNSAEAATRLRAVGHFLPKTVVVSTPQGADSQAQSQVQQFRATPGGANYLQAFAKRECARQNVRLRTVQAKMAGHLDQDGNPYVPDTPWKVLFDRGAIMGDKMYLYEVDYRLDPKEGQTTALAFCNVGTIVADIPAGV